MLSDEEIRRLTADLGLVFPYPDDKQFQSVSVDLTLGSVAPELRMSRNGYWLEPGQFVLGSTSETIRMPDYIVGQVHGKSTMARMGLMVECAGLVDPGFSGEITLEMKNLAHQRIRLSIGMLICQISFTVVEGHVDRPYGHPDLDSHYQNQFGPTEARL